MAKKPWLVASLVKLRSQIDALYPGRSKASDGWVGDTAHSARKSDHNPDSTGAVRALDITHDPAHGVDIANIAKALVAGKDRRVSYIIVNGEIISGSGGPSPWKRRKYTGANKHNKHIHISVTSANQSDASAWSLSGIETVKKSVPTKEPPVVVLKRGAQGPLVEELQRTLNALGCGPLTVDGDFGLATETAVKRLQARFGLKVDGYAGMRTSKAMGEALKALEVAPKLEAAKQDVKEAKAETAVAEKTVPPAATHEVKEKTNWGSWLLGLLGIGGGGASAAFGAEWQTIAAIGGVVILALIVLFLMRRQIVAAFKEINSDARQ